MQEAKDKIREYTNAYLELCKDEVGAFIKQARSKVDLQVNKFGLTKNTDTEIRVLTEVPATLYAILESRLTPEHFEWYRSKPGTRWFAKAYPIFKIVEKI